MSPHIYIISATNFYGGGEAFIAKFCHAMKNHSITVISPNVSRLFEELDSTDTAVIKIKKSGIFFKLSLIYWIYSNRANLKKSRVLLNGRGAAYFSVFFSIFGIRRQFILMHTDLEKCRSWKQFFFMQCCKMAEKTILVSNYLFNSFKNKTNLINISCVLHWPTGCRSTEEYIRQRYNGSEAKAVIASRLETEKGVDEAIKGFLNSSVITLDVIGDGKIASLLREKYNDSRIKFMGHKTNVPKLLNQYNLMIAPSHSESASLILMEALQAGVLCICSDIPAHREMLGNNYPNHFFFPPGDTSGITKALESAVHSIRNTPEWIAATIIESQRQLYGRASKDIAVNQYEDILDLNT